MRLLTTLALPLLLLLAHLPSHAQPSFPAERAVQEVVTFKIALDLHNGRSFCVSKAATTLLPTPVTRVNGDVASTVRQLARSFPCRADTPFSAEPFSPADVLSRIAGLFVGRVDEASVASEAFQRAYDLATVAALLEMQSVCFKGTPAEKEQLAEFRAKVAARGYMGNMHTAEISSMLQAFAACRS